MFHFPAMSGRYRATLFFYYPLNRTEDTQENQRLTQLDLIRHLLVTSPCVSIWSTTRRCKITTRSSNIEHPHGIKLACDIALRGLNQTRGTGPKLKSCWQLNHSKNSMSLMQSKCWWPCSQELDSSTLREIKGRTKLYYLCSLIII
jgi:hypothetical protein